MNYVTNVCRHIAKEDEEGAAGREASESSQQTGAGRQEHFSCAEWPGETGDPSTDRNETCQVSHKCMLTVLYKQVYKILHCPLQDIFGNTWECHLQGLGDLLNTIFFFCHTNLLSPAYTVNLYSNIHLATNLYSLIT